MDYKHVAIHVGTLIKYDSARNEIDSAAKSIFNFNREPFPETKMIRSKRASLFYDWVMTLAKQKMDSKPLNKLLIEFCKMIVPKEKTDSLEKILDDAEIPHKKEPLSEFIVRGFHEQIHDSSSEEFKNKKYAYAVFEAAKVYEKIIKSKFKNPIDSRTKKSRGGQNLMESAWGCENGVFKITQCESDTDKSIQRGMGFLSAGLISAFRNPAAHEPSTDWKISKEECLDILSLMSFLFGKLDKAAYYERQNEA